LIDADAEPGREWVAGADADADAEPMDVNAVADTNAGADEPYGRECICFQIARRK
jgi:hypothetical protein